MEDITSAGFATTAIRCAAAAVGFALISAVLYEAHYRLSGPRINVIYSMNSEVGTGSRLRWFQDVLAIVIALSPWFGLAAGLVHAKISLIDLFEKLQQTNIKPVDLDHVPEPSVLAVAAAILILGLVIASLVATHPKSWTLQRTVMMLNPLAAGLVFRLLVGAPPLAATGFRPGASLIAIVLVGAYYVGYHRIDLLRAYVFRTKALREDNNLSMRQWQRIVLSGWALLPWFVALVLYLLLPAFGTLRSWLVGTATASENATALPSLTMIPVAICWVVATGLAVAASLHRLREHFTARLWLYVTVCALAIAGLLLFWRASPDFIVTVYRYLGPLCALALSLLFLISIFVVLAVLSQRSHFPAFTLVIITLVVGSLLPNEWWTLLICALCLILAAVAVLSRLLPAAAVALLVMAVLLFNHFRSQEPIGLNHEAAADTLTQQFDEWLANKGVPAVGGTPAQPAVDLCFATPTAVTPDGQKYPVYIIAVEGGGIYAAAAASMLLARLQDENPCFSDHVFAISGVSGGAIGATIFQAVETARLNEAMEAHTPSALLAKRANAAEPTSMLTFDRVERCGPPPTADIRGPMNFLLEREVCRIVAGDHFSPLIASIFPELLGFTKKGRPFELAAGFQQSAKRVDREAGTVLNAPFASDWSVRSKAPALVLNATWVETGLRAAFAPFPLHNADDSLYSFVDADMPANQAEPLIRAAVVSARFPFVLPPYSMRVKPSAAPDQTSSTIAASASSNPLPYWNFVDGAYTDNSGAATALAVYKALFSIAQSRHVSLRLILLTSSDPKLATNKIRGTTFADVMGPVNAVLSVRASLASQAVARTCDGILSLAGEAGAAAVEGPSIVAKEKALNTCEELANQPDLALQIIGIEDETYGLSLGWKISQTTLSVVSWMLGRSDMVNPDVCNRLAGPGNATSQVNGKFVLNEQVVERNSCVLWSIRQALEQAAPAP